MRKGDCTRLRIIDEATRQASARGLGGISLADVAAPAGISKSGLFKHFDSKEAMQQAVLASSFDRFLGYVWAPVSDQPAGRPRLEAVFERWLTWGHVECAASGCPITAMATELDDQPGPLREYLRGRILSWRKHIVADFKALRCPAASDAEAWQAVFEMKAFILGYNEASRLLEDPKALTHTRAAFAHLLDRIAGKA